MVHRSTCMRVAAAFAAAAALPAPAHAAGGDWYAAAGGTLSFLGTQPGTIANAPTPGSTVEVEEPYDPGFGGFVAAGRAFGRFRVEGEIGYARDTADRYRAIAPPNGEIFADIEASSLRAMANVLLDFEAGGLEPYVGVGAGYAWSDLTVIAPRAIFPTEQPRLLIDDTEGGFAYQAMAGVAFPAGERLRITFGYRRFDAGDFVGVDGRNEEITRGRGAHNIDLGLRGSF